MKKLNSIQFYGMPLPIYAFFAIIVLACIIFSAFSSSGTPVIDSSASVVTQVWSYLGEVVFNLLVLVGLVKSADHIAKEMLGL